MSAILSLFRPSVSLLLLGPLSVLIFVGTAHAVTISFIPPVKGVGQLEVAHEVAVGDDLVVGAAIQRTKVDQSNNRQVNFDVLSMNFSRTFAEGGTSLSGGLGFLPETNIKCLRINKLFLGNCLTPDISISRSGKRLDFMTTDFQNMYIEIEHDLFVSDRHHLSVDVGSVFGQLSYDSPFLTVTNPLILSSNIGTGTVETARDAFLNEQPTDDSYQYAYVGAHYTMEGSLWSIRYRPSISVSQLTGVSSNGVWQPEKLIVETSLELDLYSALDRRIFIATTFGNFFDHDVTSVYLNPLTFRDEPEWIGQVKVGLAF